MYEKDQKYFIKCLHAPNKDSVESDNNNESSKFVKEVFNNKEDQEYHNCILAKDYNVALDHDKDTNGYINVN